jgi:N-acetyl sugar amidotransferase
MINYCKTCLSPDTRPGGEFIDGNCLPCFYTASNQAVNYPVKLEMLKRVYKNSRKGQKNKSDFDCVVGVSGGKDSSRQAHWVRDRLGLRPLLVCIAYPPKQMSSIGAINLSNLIDMGFDLITVTPAPDSSRKLSKEGFYKFGNVSKASEKALYSTVPRVAIDLGINSIFWGENNALQVGEKSVMGTGEFDGNNLRNMNTLISGGDTWINDVVGSKKGLHYVYPDVIEFARQKINVFFLGPAWDDWSNINNSSYAALHGLTLRPGEERVTGDISNASMLDEEFTNINMMIKYYKYGFGRATDIVNESIRLGQLTRVDGIKLVEEFDGVCGDSIIDNYCKYIGISRKEFWAVVYTYTNKELFDIKENIERPIRKFNIH